MWFGSIWLIYGLGGSNSDLGFIIGFSSIISIFSTLLSSYLADKYRYDLVVFVGIFIGIVGVFIISFATSLQAVFIGQIFTAIGFSIVGPVEIAILAGSLQTSNRTKAFGTQFLIQEGFAAIAGIIGYFIYNSIDTNSIATINLGVLRLIIFFCGILACCELVILIFLLRDKHMIKQSSKSKATSEYDQTRTSNEDGLIADYRPYHSKKSTVKERLLSVKSQFPPGGFSVVIISLFIAYLIGTGAGITIPFLPRFFFDIYSVSLAELSLLMAVVSIFTAIWGKINANLATRFGKVQIIVLNQSISVLLLYMLAIYPPLYLALSALIIRNAVMNGVGPVATAILMDQFTATLSVKG